MKKTIKIMAMLLFAAILTTFVSCSKSDNYENLIVGKWKCTYGSQFMAVFKTGTVYEFDENGVLRFNDPWGSEIVSYRLDNDMLYITLVGDLICQIETINNTSMKLISINGDTDHYIFNRL